MMYNYFYCTRSEMDIISAFEAVVGGSNPSGCTPYLCPLLKCCQIRIIHKTSPKDEQMWITMLIMFIKDIKNLVFYKQILTKYVVK